MHFQLLKYTGNQWCSNDEVSVIYCTWISVVLVSMSACGQVTSVVIHEHVNDTWWFTTLPIQSTLFTGWSITFISSLAMYDNSCSTCWCRLAILCTPTQPVQQLATHTTLCLQQNWNPTTQWHNAFSTIVQYALLSSCCWILGRDAPVIRTRTPNTFSWQQCWRLPTVRKTVRQCVWLTAMQLLVCHPPW